MIIGLYKDHHQLPFWHSPKLPFELFSPEIHGARVFTFYHGSDREEKQPVPESWIWPVLMGLHMLEIHAMAHVSTFCDHEGPDIWHYPKRVWVQISTLPDVVNEAGIPVTVVEGKTVVQGLWGWDNGTYTPYEFLPEDQRKSTPENSQPEFWRDFFLAQLKGVKIATTSAHSKAVAEAEAAKKLLAVIPD